MKSKLFSAFIKFILITSIFFLCISPIENWSITLFSLWGLVFLVALLGNDLLLKPVLFASGFQWLQASIEIFRANFSGAPLQAASEFPYLTIACSLSIMGVIMFAVGARLGCGLNTKIDLSAMTDSIERLSPARIAIAYFLVFGLTLFQSLMVEVMPGLSQGFLVFVVLRESLLLLLAINVFAIKKGYKFLFSAFFFSFLSGFVSYFSTFKFSLFWLIISFLIYPSFLKKNRNRIFLSIVLAFTLITSLYWTAVKVEYRAFLNQGTQSQVVITSWQDSLLFLNQLISKTSTEDLSVAADRLSERVGYTQYFAAVIDREQKGINPKEKLLWGNAMIHVLIPRMIYPDKPILDDSKQTNIYTGLGVAGRNRGASISLGYISESYIDFGSFGMFLPIFILGWIYGKLLKSLSHPKVPQPLGFIFASVIFVMAGGAVETSAAKHLGGLIVRYLSSLLILTLFGKRLIAQLGSPVNKNSLQMLVYPSNSQYLLRSQDKDI